MMATSITTLPETDMVNDLLCQPTTNSNASSGARRISRVPCKARGISDNHNAWNSYIDIPADAKHGNELSCSNAHCASSGRKFRYCAMCALPVASRNFLKRHSHSMMGPPKPTPTSNKRVNLGEDIVRTKKIRTVPSDGIPYSVEIPDEVGSTTRTLELTSQELKFLDLMQFRPSDDSPYLASWIQSVLDATSQVSSASKPATTSAMLDDVESYERAQLKGAVLDDEEDVSLESAFGFEIGGKFSHGEY